VNKPEELSPVSFALVGDFGAGYFLGTERIPEQNPNARGVAEGIRKFVPIASDAYIVSLGDQIYEPYDGLPSTEYPFTAETCPVSGMEAYDQTIGELYAPYILFPQGSRSAYAGRGSKKQRFLAILGDHDWWHQPRTKVYNQLAYPLNTAAYPAQVAPDQPLYHLNDSEGRPVGFMEYFSNQGEGSSSGNCRYWDQVRGNIHWFALSSDSNEVLLGTLTNGYYSSPLPGGLLPDGMTPGEQNQRCSLQGKWFSNVLEKSSSPWKFVITHHAPFTSSSKANHLGGHPCSTYMQWDYASLGIDMVFSGHVHNYERLYKDGVLYVVNGAGGTFKQLAGYVDPPLAISRKRITQAYGFMTCVEGAGTMAFAYHALTPQTELPYRPQEPSVEDSFILLNKGMLNSREEMESPDSIIITQGGGVLDLNGFDVALSAQLQGRGELTKKGSGALSLGMTHPDFEGTLEIQEGSLELAADQVLSETVHLMGSGGELIVSGICQRFDTFLLIKGAIAMRLMNGGRIEFADSSESAWGAEAYLRIIGNMAPGSIRFGNNSSGLTPQQLSCIRMEEDPEQRFTLDEQGFVIPATI
jgi:hypothetical protein